MHKKFKYTFFSRSSFFYFLCLVSQISFAQQPIPIKVAELQWKVCHPNWERLVEKLGTRIVEEEDRRFEFYFTDENNRMNAEDMSLRLRVNEKNEAKYTFKKSFPHTEQHKGLLVNSESFKKCELDVERDSKSEEFKLKTNIECKTNQKNKNQFSYQEIKSKLSIDAEKFKLIPNEVEGLFNKYVNNDRDRGRWTNLDPILSVEKVYRLNKKIGKENAIASFEKIDFKKNYQNGNAISFSRVEISVRVEYKTDKEYQKYYDSFSRYFKILISCKDQSGGFSKESVSDYLVPYINKQY
ncbi:MAG: hypothetical protein QE271_00760 [Bacteriovoracaceae bacterium]|nr:hypothetical protein [Bacteriovoracaceae bacterium]